jgi:hypothetical protein
MDCNYTYIFSHLVVALKLSFLPQICTQDLSFFLYQSDTSEVTQNTYRELSPRLEVKLLGISYVQVDQFRRNEHMSFFLKIFNQWTIKRPG